MANFTLETNRNKAIENIPRLTFQLPQSTTTNVPSTVSPIFFCQTGCQLEFEFKNITSATLKNDGNYFTIIPNEDSNNYINWNGSGISGQNMTRFDLKEIKFATPAKDVVGEITYNKSIQLFITFVNSTHTNIMIIITIIGQANNVGTAQTDGFILLDSLAPQIPLRNDTRTVTNLENVNLGNLLPSNKSFFSTLIDNNSLQYISMTRVIDIPNSFLNNLISRIIGSQQAYESKVNQYTQQIPTNPPGTIIFYTENVQPINSDQAYVCNANCDRIVGDAKLLQPIIGTSRSTTKSAPKSTTTTTTNAKKIGGKDKITKLQEEECEEEFIFPGRRTNVKVKKGSTSTSDNPLNPTELNDKETKYAMEEGTVIGGIIAGIILSMSAIFWLLTKSLKLSILQFFSKELWLNKDNIPWIIIAFIGFLGITACFISYIFVSKEENEINENTKPKYKIQSWALLLIGIIGFYLPCCILLVLKFKNIIGTKKIDELQSLMNKISNENTKQFNESTSKKNIIKASKIYNSLSNEQKSELSKNNPDLKKLLTMDDKKLSSLSEKKKKELINLIKKLDNNPIAITPEIVSTYEALLAAKQNTSEYNDLVKYKNNIKIGEVVPQGLKKILEKK